MRRATLSLGCLLLMAACDDGGDERVPLPCDVRTTACQRSVFEETAKARNQRDATPPPVRIISREQLEDELRSALSRSEREPEDEDAILVRKTREGLALLGLLSSEQSYDEAYIQQAVASIAAYYSSAAKDITIIADEAQNDEDATFTLAHEYVHALQDQREDLAALRNRFVQTSDDDVALTSLIEGEATWLSIVTYGAAVHEQDPDDIDTRRVFDGYLEGTLENIEAAQAPLINASELLPYALGGRYVSTYYLEEGQGAVERLYDDPPLTLRAWFNQDSSLYPAGRSLPVPDGLPEPLDCGAPEPPAGYEPLLEDRLGLAGLLALRIAQGEPAIDAYGAAHWWRSDVVLSYGSSDDPEAVAIAWRIRLAGESAAEELAALLRSSGATVAQQEREVLIAAATDAALLSSWPDGSACPARDKARRRVTWPAPRVTLKERLGLVR